MIQSRSTTLIIAIACTLQANAQLTLSPMFGDHMVLQRELPAPVWGKADPGTTVTVRFAGHKVVTRAAQDGRWMLQLPAHLHKSLDVPVAAIVTCWGSSTHFKSKSPYRLLMRPHQ